MNGWIISGVLLAVIVILFMWNKNSQYISRNVSGNREEILLFNDNNVGVGVIRNSGKQSRTFLYVNVGGLGDKAKVNKYKSTNREKQVIDESDPGIQAYKEGSLILFDITGIMNKIK